MTRGSTAVTLVDDLRCGYRGCRCSRRSSPFVHHNAIHRLHIMNLSKGHEIHKEEFRATQACNSKCDGVDARKTTPVDRRLPLLLTAVVTRARGDASPKAAQHDQHENTSPNAFMTVTAEPASLLPRLEADSAVGTGTVSLQSPPPPSPCAHATDTTRASSMRSRSGSGKLVPLLPCAKPT